MEMTAALKSELSPGKRHMCILEGDNTVVANKCIKRRRRDSSSSAVAAVGCKEQQQAGQQQPQADQSAAAATTTPVKRSSRFRGVSRFIKMEFLFSYGFENSCLINAVHVHQVFWF